MRTHEILKKHFLKKKSAARGFSLRSCARSLQISPGFLSRILSGQKPVPFALLQRLGPALDIESEVFTALKDSAVLSPTQQESNLKTDAETQSALEDWDLAQPGSQNILRQWYSLAILEMTTTTDCDGSPQSIAEKLGLTVVAVEIALRQLNSLGLVELRENRFVKTTEKLRWGSAKSLEDVRRFHDQMMTRAQLLLRAGAEPEDFERRLIAGITVTASAEKIAAAKVKLSECLHEIANDLASSPGSEVYHLAGQLFPLTRRTTTR